MIISFNCDCGNTDPDKAECYDGCLGYVALICLVCGDYSDHFGKHPKDDWSKRYLKTGPYIPDLNY